MIVNEIKFIKPKRPVSTVFLHCSASDNPADDNIDTIRRWHLARGMTNIGYNYYINKAGAMFLGRDTEKIPAAQKGFNTGSIAICLGGLKTFTPEQLATLKRLCGEINQAYHGYITFHGHKEVNPNKTCPVYDYVKLLGLIDRGKKLSQRGFMPL